MSGLQAQTLSTEEPTEYVFPALYAAQRAAIANDKRYSIIEASTKSGKTIGCIIWLLSTALAEGRDGRVYWWIAPVWGQAKIAYRRTKLAIEVGEDANGDEDGSMGFVKANDTELSIWLENGARIDFKSGQDSDNLFGEEVHAAVIDEASRMKEESFVAVRSTLTKTNGPLRIIGNVKGRRGWFYTLARRAEANQLEDWHYARLTAYDAIEGKVLTAAEIADAKALLPERVFKELYMAEPSDDEGNPFGLDNIRQIISEMSQGEPHVWGWDLAKSTDWTVGVALDEHGNVCRFERWQHQTWDYTEARILDLVNNETALIDSTGLGDPIVERLKLRNPMIEGFKFTAPSKQQLMEGLSVAIQNQEITVPDNEIKFELEAFEYVYSAVGGVKYSAPSGLHDDCVCALALAVRSFKDTPTSFGIW